MDRNQAVLEDYEVEMANLLQEISQLRTVNGNVQELNERLETIQQAYATAGKALLGVAERTRTILKEIESLRLSDVPSSVHEHYEKHQSSLASLDQSIKDAVREQQRLGLEMLQNTTASQTQFNAFVTRDQQAAEDAIKRSDGLKQQVTDLTSVSNGKLSNLSDQVTALTTLSTSKLDTLSDQVGVVRTLAAMNVGLVILVCVILFVR